ncbi:MAG TPA: ABC transporter ATP-binding protein [Gemmatimonadales bacterium]|nr:ABC transporter ATP-binding protein [Gemmatimonadales bacterium]
MSGPPLAIETEGLGRDYGKTRALAALDLSLPAGALVGILGPNGAGKTTAMLLLATLLAPSRGAARVFGHDVVRDRAAVRRRLGLVFQEPSIDGLLTVEENLRFAARLVGLGGQLQRDAVKQAIERTGLAARAGQPARQLSGGWRRLADIARATLHRPPLLILDEPTVGLDPEHRDRMWRLLDAERSERGATILFSTHYLSEAEPSDRVVMLARGRVVADEAPAALRSALGEQVAELEGEGAAGVLEALRSRGLVRSARPTDRGWRIALGGGGDVAGKLAAAAGAARITRLALRPATLEDVYFDRTQARESEFGS